jgi:hypothetical protein
MTSVASWQYVHADVSQSHRKSLQLNHLRHLSFKQRDLPSGWTEVGCFTWVMHELSKRADLLTLLQIRDNTTARTLTSAGYTDTKSMTVENCVNYCTSLNFIYAGVEYGQECCEWCFSVIHAHAFSFVSVILITVWDHKIVGIRYQMGR